MAKVKKYGKGGDINAEHRKEIQRRFSSLKSEQEAKDKAREEETAIAKKAAADKIAKDTYDYAANKYATEVLRDKPGSINDTLNKFMDTAGDKARQVGSYFGINRMTSQDDEAKMKARQDIKGYKKGGAVKKMAKGGSVSSASKRADGCCVKGKTRGKIV